MITFYDELIDFLCPNTRETWEHPLLPNVPNYCEGDKLNWNGCFYEILRDSKINNTNKQPQMKQQKFNSGTMIAVITPRGTTVAILAEDFTYEKPQMVAVKTMLTHDGILTISDKIGQGQLYIHQDCIEVRLANEQEGLRLFSAIRASGAEMPKVKEMEVKEFIPSDGDFVTITWDVGKCIYIYKSECENESDSVNVYCGLTTSKLLELDDIFGLHSPLLSSSASSELEKIELLDALAKDGKTWNATEKRVENVLWRADKDDQFFTPINSRTKGFVVTSHHDYYDEYCNALYESGRYFQHESDCQLLCDQLNAVIKANKESRVKLN